MTENIGVCMGETTPLYVDFISNDVLQMGEYVYLNYDNKTILGMVESVYRGNLTLQNDLISQDKILKILKFEGELEHYTRGTIKILGDKDNLQIPKIPAPPGTLIKKASTQLLQEIFEREQGLKIGNILTKPDVPVSLDINTIVSRHLAILAMTGAGKSNTTSVIIDELLKVNGCILLFDMHSEYANAKFTNGEVNKISPQINPRELKLNEYKKLARFSENATNQEAYLRKCFDKAESQTKEGTTENFLDTMLNEINLNITKIENEEKVKQSHLDAVQQVEFKLEDMKRKYEKILESTDIGDIIDRIKPGYVNVIKLGSLDENMTDIFVNHVLYKILYERKLYMDPQKRKNSKLDFPIFCIIEEAHMLASNQMNTQSKGMISKIAREGRKFGVGLCLVSQSPKSLDSNTLSQINNLILLRLIEPKDQQHVQKSSENLSEDLIKQLPALNVGEAILLGKMTKIPTMIKIDEFKGKTVGSDLDVVKEWANKKENDEKELQKQNDELEAFYG